MVTKVEAARIATGSGIPVVLTVRAARPPRRCAGEPVGTLFHRVRQRPAARLFWLAHATSPRGRLHLDPGAVQAVVGPAHVAAAGRHHRGRRRFTAGDPVDLVDAGGRAGRPRAGQLRRRRAARPARPVHRASSPPSSGPAYEREVVHRDDLVLL